MAKALPLYAVNPQESLRSNAPLMLHTRLEELYQFTPYISDPAKVDELHNMRIASKRLRYTLEIFAPCFSGKDFEKVSSQVKSIQEQIGTALYRKFIAFWDKLQKQGFKREFLQMLVQTQDVPSEAVAE